MGYIEIIEDLRSCVLDGKWKPGSKMASERELCQRYSVSGATIKKSLKELEREGLIRSHQGKGRFVTSPHDRPKSWTVGVVMYDLSYISNPIESQILEGINKSLASTDYHLNLFGVNTQANTNDPFEIFESWAKPNNGQKSIDGVILETKQLNISDVIGIANAVPVIWLNHPSVKPGLLGVRVNYFKGVYTAVEHLVELGHRNIALVTTHEYFNVGRGQQDGFRLAVDRLLKPSGGTGRVYYAEKFSQEQGKCTVKKILDESEQPTAIIGGSGALSEGIYDILIQAELKVPRDISLVSMADTISEKEIPVPMTALYADHMDLGCRGVEQFLWMMEHPGDFAPSKQIEMKLNVRESTAPPRSVKEGKGAC